tara:strand:+ start:19408 stop:19833 length:426 start_codon:yes stop_codon:yes gene_type:complete
MRYFKFLLAIVLTATVLISCQDKKGEKWEETMKVHDAVMLKMQETGEMQAKLNQLIMRAKQDSSTILYTKLDTLQIAFDALEKADVEMMDWMAHIQKPRKNDNQDSVLNYLEQEQQSITAVGVTMDNAVTQAENILKSLEK